jgi:hypothetical protein
MMKTASLAGDWQMCFRLYQRLSTVRTRRQVGDISETKTNKQLEAEAEDIRSLTVVERLRWRLNRITPDKHTYSILLNACANRGGDAAYDDAMALYADMKADLSLQSQNVGMGNVLVMDAEVVNAALMTCRHAEDRGRVEMAFKLLREEFGEYFDWDVFERYHQEVHGEANVLSSRLSPGFQWRTETSSVVYPTPVIPNAKTVSILITIMIQKLGFPVDVIRSLYTFLTSPSQFRFYRTVTPDSALHTSYLQLLVDADAIPEAMNLFKHLCLHRSGRVRTVMPPYSFQSMLKACVKTENAVKALEYWAMMTEYADRNLLTDNKRGVFRPTPMSIVYLMKSLQDAGKVREVIDVLCGLEGSGWRQVLMKELQDVDAVWHMGSIACRDLLKQGLKGNDMERVIALRTQWRKKCADLLAAKNKKESEAATDDETTEEDDDEVKLTLPAVSAQTKTPKWLRRQFQTKLAQTK